MIIYFIKKNLKWYFI